LTPAWISRRTALTLLLAFTMVMAVLPVFLPRFAQPLEYHAFADRRTWFGISNFLDVISNFPFAILGLMGLIFIRTSRSRSSFVDMRERWPYLAMFAGLLLTAFGSGYYHLDPNNSRLLWDRLPMTIVFMSIIAAMIVERVSVRAGLYLLLPMVVIGAGSSIQWYVSELRGLGDLRFYAAVQVYAVLVLPLMMWLFPARYTRTSDIGVIVGFYVLAKVFEAFDRQIYAALGHAVSGHTLKHLAAAMAGYWILRMLKRRVPVDVAHNPAGSAKLAC